jgi:ferritin-like metal-binding protein YciE
MSTQQTPVDASEAFRFGEASEKNTKTMVEYLGDMLSIEGHIEEALDRQLTSTKDHPGASAAVQRFHDMVKANKLKLEQHLEGVTDSKGNPVKEIGANLLGKAAGIINWVRTEGVSKSLRDDYVAFNLAAISYSMLETTARALGDENSVALAQEGLRDYAGAVQEINQLISEVVVWELEKDGHRVEQGAADKTRNNIKKAWKETAPKAGAVH